MSKSHNTNQSLQRKEAGYEVERNVTGTKEMTLCWYMAGCVKAINKLCITLSSVHGAFQNHTEEWKGGPLSYCIALHSEHVHLYANTVLQWIL